MKKLMLIFSLVLVLCVCGCSEKKVVEIDFDEIVNEYQDVSLSVYYSEVGFDFLSRAPLSGEYFTFGYESGNQDIVRDYFDSTQLKEFSDHFKGFGKKEYTYIDDNDTSINARLVYVFESEKNGKLLEVVLGNNGMVCVNGNYIVVYDDLDALNFYEVILPFITNESVKNGIADHIALCNKMYELKN